MEGIKTFPIMLDDRIQSIPWDLIAPHDAQARANHHGQTIDKLAARGGITVTEALAIVEDRPWERMPFTAAYLQLKAHVDDFLGVEPTQDDLVAAALHDAMAEWDAADTPRIMPPVPPLDVVSRLDTGIALATRMRASGAPRHLCNELIGIMQSVREHVHG